ncbi:MAG: hypothetical protein HUJ76_00325 [Parasporobacterium sp.]|nr:hypothetical protein [Parasporobacterium sp.]
MLEFQSIQQRGFHNTYDEKGNITGFEFKFTPKYYKGLWFTQCRFGNVKVDGKVYDRDSLTYVYNGLDYTREEMFDTEKYWQFRTAITVKVPCEGGLSVGYHDVVMDFGWVLNYNGALEAEADGSGMGNMAHMFGVENKRRMLLCR